MDIIEYLLEQGAQPNEAPATHAGGTALQLTAIKGQLGVAGKLLALNADVNAEPAKFDGRTAFEGATEHRRIDIMLVLFQHGVDLLRDNHYTIPQLRLRNVTGDVRGEFPHLTGSRQVASPVRLTSRLCSRRCANLRRKVFEWYKQLALQVF
jgi:hypothetical protein